MAKLIKKWPAIKRGWTLSVYTSPCIVTRPPHTQQPSTSRALVNPANEQLLGTALPYFPMGGGPSSKKLHNSMSTQTIDGILTHFGGTALREACNQVPVCKGVELIGGGGDPTGGVAGVRCPVGSAVTTPAFGIAVREHYQTIVHTVPPLWPGNGVTKLSEDRAKSLLSSCSYQALKVGFSAGTSVVTMPLIGAGARRAPLGTAIECVAEGILKAILEDIGGTSGQVEVVVLELGSAEILVNALDVKLDQIQIEAG